MLVHRELILRLSAPRDPLRDPDLWASEAIYRRVVEGDRGRAEVYVLYFAVQLIPFHVWDYEPVLVYLDRQKRTVGCIYDALHYNIGWARGPELVLAWPWRCLHEGVTERKIDLRTLGPVRELTDEVIELWRSREHNPLSIDDLFFEDPWAALEEFQRGERETFRAGRERPLGELGVSVSPVDNRLKRALEAFEQTLRFIEEERDRIRAQGLPPGLVAEYVLSMAASRGERLRNFVDSKGLALVRPITLGAEVDELERELRERVRLASL